ncbi:four helix bundle protein [Solimonas aquatica]|uniref:four helix bundle protein n=1 Tax=Solimonas aquatica TaxID=489703 RepID=UPI000B8A4FC4|nr:four helix bundle protein [Solimonas aquatica]
MRTKSSARKSRAEPAQALHIARGCWAEYRHQLQIARRLKLPAADDSLDALLDRVFAKLGALLNSLKATPP